MKLNINNLKTSGERLECVRLLIKKQKSFFYRLFETTPYTYKNVIENKDPFPLEWAYTLKEKFFINIRWLKDGKGDIFSKTLDESLSEGVVEWKK